MFHRWFCCPSKTKSRNSKGQSQWRNCTSQFREKHRRLATTHYDIAVGGWTNQCWKNMSQIGSFSLGRGENQDIYETTTQDILIFGRLNVLTEKKHVLSRMDQIVQNDGAPFEVYRCIMCTYRYIYIYVYRYTCECPLFLLFNSNESFQRRSFPTYTESHQRGSQV